ncbi:membrane protein [Novosphingobium sp. Rr 2-17]|uniref:LysM peptidoglycan-binding domain-containing M23 family metallopeptidase n=1 Tax=Novosphingobium sp. Rr 2-17 TaxID=555793 RepID=UPI000269853C|nr:LysM peptidoglycan-binding domain-containing M23 family metallopeptidase [Novosphingobium sp. Rr 2-17]EIZ78564.1 membrane protein [Novosphingobium sp. Rr 2-17]
MIRAALLLTGAVIGTPAIAAPASEEAIHVVREGETLNGVANRAGVSPEAIVKANGLKAPYVVRLGQKLTIPRTAATKLAVTPRAPTAEKASAIAKPSAIKPSTDKARADSLPPKAAASPAASNLAAHNAAKTAARVIAARSPPAPIDTPATETQHLVQPGETLGGIAQRANVPRILIIEANRLQPPYAVKVGQKLQLPRTRRHTVVAGDSGFAIAMKYGVPWEQIALANSLDTATPVKPGQTLLIPTLMDPPPTGVKTMAPSPVVPAIVKAPRPPRFTWPLTGTIKRGYSTGSDYHDGIDIPAAKGTMVRAAAAGTVKFAGKEKDQFGNLVVLDHGDGWYTAYGFLSRVTVKEGASVAAGERVGLVGDTGKAKGNELHFEVRREGKPVDPLDELPKAP